MSVNFVTGTQGKELYNTYNSQPAAQKEDQQVKAGEEQSAVYEKSETKKENGVIYSVNKMSSADRAALVKQMKADQEARQQSLISLVQNMMTKQAATSGLAKGTDNDSIWKFLASGNFTVDEAAKEQAQKDIAEDGYWGVKQTSQRLFDFASALAGDDVEKMKKMQEAMQKGYEQATGAWGKELPEISKNTLEAANKLFEDYYDSKN